MQQTNEQAQVVQVSSQQEKNAQGKVKQYGKYTVQSTFAENCSITDIINCYIELKRRLSTNNKRIKEEQQEEEGCDKVTAFIH